MMSALPGLLLIERINQRRAISRDGADVASCADTGLSSDDAGGIRAHHGKSFIV